MIKRDKTPRIFFGWLTVIAGSIITFWSHGYYYYGLSALFMPISTELGFSRAATSVAASIGRLEGGIEAPLTGWIVDKYGPRWIVIAGIILISLGFVLMYFVDSLWSYYAVWGVVIATGVNIGTGLPFEKAISNWFVKKRGLTISIRWGIAGLCVVAVLPLVAWLITIYGWRLTCVIGGVVMLIIGLPVAWFWVKQKRPEYYGLLPDGATAREDPPGEDQLIKRGAEYAAEVEEVEFTLRQAIKTPAYWLLIIAAIGSGIFIQTIIIHSIPFLTDMGIDPVKAALIVGTISLLSIVTRFIAGVFADRIKRDHLRFLMGGAYFLMAVGLITFLLQPTMTTVYVLYSFYYAAFGVTLPLGGIIRARYFGRKAFGSIQGTSMTLMTPVGILGPIYAGWVYDTTGSYMTAFTLIAVLVTISAIVMSLARPPKPPAEITGVDSFL